MSGNNQNDDDLKRRLREHNDDHLYLEADELMCEAANRIEQLEAAPQLSDLPSAWELWVRYSDESRHPNREWKRYGLYETKARAKATMKRVEGPPLELKIVPLYAVEETE